MDYNRSVTDLSCVVVSGVSGRIAGDIIPFQTAAQNNLIGAVAGCVLLAGTYRFVVSSPSGDSETPAQVTVLGVQLAWTAAVAGTMVPKMCNFPGNLDKFGRGGVDVSDFDANFWTPHNPSTAFVPVTGTNNTVSAATVTAGGTAAGTADYQFSGLGARRVAIELVLTAGGIVRCNACGKLGS